MIQSCLVCLEENQQFVTDYHSCQICKPCVIQWVEEKTRLQDSDNIPCMIDGCKNKFLMTDIHHELNSDPKFQEIMFQNYIRKEKDIRPCPKSGCRGFAFTPQTRCGKDLQCPTCNFEWTDRNYLSHSHLIYLFLKEIKNETCTAIVEFFCTQLCPKCESNIWKNGGCSHMTCKKCSFYFCWLCKQDLNKHRNPVCASRFFILLLQLIIVILTMMHSLEILFVFGYLLYPFIYLYYFIAYNIILAVPIGVTYLSCWVYQDFRTYLRTKREYKYKLHDCLFGILFTVLSILAGIGLWQLLDILGFQETLVEYQMYQEGILAGCAVLFFGFKALRELRLNKIKAY